MGSSRQILFYLHSPMSNYWVFKSSQGHLWFFDNFLSLQYLKGTFLFSSASLHTVIIISRILFMNQMLDIWELRFLVWSWSDWIWDRWTSASIIQEGLESLRTEDVLSAQNALTDKGKTGFSLNTENVVVQWKKVLFVSIDFWIQLDFRENDEIKRINCY